MPRHVLHPPAPEANGHPQGVVSLATGAGPLYLLYSGHQGRHKMSAAPSCSPHPSASPAECPRPGERARPQEVPIPQASEGPKGTLHIPLCALLTSISRRPILEMLEQGPQIVDDTQVHPQGSFGRFLNSPVFTLASRMDRNWYQQFSPRKTGGPMCSGPPLISVTTQCKVEKETLSARLCVATC